MFNALRKRAVARKDDGKYTLTLTVTVGFRSTSDDITRTLRLYTRDGKRLLGAVSARVSQATDNKFTRKITVRNCTDTQFRLEIQYGSLMTLANYPNLGDRPMYAKNAQASMELAGNLYLSYRVDQWTF